MKKIILSTAIIVGVGALVVGATTALFSDTEVVEGNTFSAATIDLELGKSETMPFEVSDALPGQSGSGSFTLTNAGSVAASLSVSLINKVDEENTIYEPESNPGYGTADYEGNGGELDFFLGFAAYIDVNQNGSFDSGDQQLTYDGQMKPYPGFWGGDFHYHGLTSMMSTPWNDIMELGSGESVDLVIMWDFPTESGDSNYSQNIAMSDILGFDVSTSLGQLTQ